MPKRLKPQPQGDFKDLAPNQVRITTVLEVGTALGKQLGKIGDAINVSCQSCQKCEGCESCQTCEGCQSCQTSSEALLVDRLGTMAEGSKGPMRLAREVVYELVEESGAGRSISEKGTRD